MVTSSGQAAQIVAISTLAQNGDNIVASQNLYGGTYNQVIWRNLIGKLSMASQFKVQLPRWGIEPRFVDVDNTKALEEAIDAKTRAMSVLVTPRDCCVTSVRSYVESIGNPKYHVPDFEALSRIAKKVRHAAIVAQDY